MRFASAALLVGGGVGFVVALALRWSSVTSTHGGVAIVSRGLDYAVYDIATTLALGALLLVAGAVVLCRRRWAAAVAVVGAVLAGFWAFLVFMAAQYPAAGAPDADLRVEVGPGAYLLVGAAAVALCGAALALVRRSVGAGGRTWPSEATPAA